MIKSLSAAQAAIPSSMVIRPTGDDYRVNFRHGSEATAYYTDDLDDAVGTAKAMAARQLGGLAVMTAENTLHVTCNDPLGHVRPQAFLVADHSMGVAFAVTCYAEANNLRPSLVEWASRRATQAEVGGR